MQTHRKNDLVDLVLEGQNLAANWRCGEWRWRRIWTLLYPSQASWALVYSPISSSRNTSNPKKCLVAPPRGWPCWIGKRFRWIFSAPGYRGRYPFRCHHGDLRPEVHQAVATAAGVGFIIGVPGAIGLILGHPKRTTPMGINRLYPRPCTARHSFMTVFTSSWGAKIAQRLNELHPNARSPTSRMRSMLSNWRNVRIN